MKRSETGRSEPPAATSASATGCSSKMPGDKARSAALTRRRLARSFSTRSSSSASRSLPNRYSGAESDSCSEAACRREARASSVRGSARRPITSTRSQPIRIAGEMGVFCLTLPSTNRRPPTRTVGKMMGIAALASACCGLRRVETYSTEASVEYSAWSVALSTKMMVCPVSTSVADRVTARTRPSATFWCSARQGTNSRTSTASGPASRREVTPSTTGLPTSQRAMAVRSPQPSLKTSSSRRDSQRSARRRTPRSGSSARAASAQALIAPTLVPQKICGIAEGPRRGASLPSA